MMARPWASPVTRRWLAVGVTLMVVVWSALPLLAQQPQPAVHCYLSDPKTGACAVFRNTLNNNNNIAGYVARGGETTASAECDASPGGYCSIPLPSGTYTIWLVEYSGHNGFACARWIGDLPAGMEVTLTSEGCPDKL